MSERKYIDLRVSGHETELTEFLAICSLIQKYGIHGVNREILISVDGDGSGKLAFFLNDDEEMLPMTEEAIPDSPPRLSIGE